ncbi:protein broad-minded-like [Watersipora subatra]|uniref:protein broad-minded-like n=1 Tax=Watersipora subatra TaxID=2589382 RepID=UPI00355C7486
MDVEALTSSIKQLVISSGKFMQESNTFEQAEERIMHLEENDDQFHKYELVKLLKQEIEDCVGPIVDEELSRCNEGGHENSFDPDTLVSRITDKVTKSHEFNELHRDITKAVHKSVEKLVHNFDEHFRGISEDDSPPGTPKQRDPLQLSDEESNLSGSYNHEGFLFVPLQQLQKYIEQLDKKNNIQTRRAALKSLTHMSLNDVLANDESYQRVWPYLERGIVDALSEDEDQILQKKALSFISRGFSSSQGNHRELYGTLTAFLYEYFADNTRQRVMKVKNGLDATRQELSTVLQAFRLMNDFQKHIPNYWVRYQTRFLNDVLEKTVMLVSVGGRGGMEIQPFLNVTPVHLLALVDPIAEWFTRWTHGSYSRLPLFEVMKRQHGFLESLVKSILEFVESRRVPFDLISEASESVASQRGTVGSHQQRFTYTGLELEYFYFVHAINIVGRILIYKQGLELFPVKIEGYKDEITITKLICAICELVTNPAGHASNFRSLTAYFGFLKLKLVVSGGFEPSIVATEILKKLCYSECTYKVCLCKDDVTNTMLMPIAHWLDSSIPEGSLAGEATLRNIADILSVMASKSVGRRHLLYGERGDTFSRSRSSAAHCLTDFCKKALKNALPAAHGQVSRLVSGSYLFLCRQLYNNGEGLQAIYGYDLHTVLSETWREASKALNGVREKQSAASKEIISWEEELKDNLLSYATTPKGVLLMQQSTAMYACIEHLCKRHRNKIQVSSLEKFGYGSVITQIAGTACGMLEFEKQGLVNLLCQEAWDSIEPGEDLEIPFQPKVWAVDAIDKSAHKPLVNLIHILSNFTSVFELLGGEKLPVNPQYTFRDRPSSLIELLDRIAIINTNKDEDKMHFLFNVEQSHVFGLRLLNALTACLDTLLLLDSQFKVLDTLISSQTTDENAGGPLIIDAISVERSHILARALIIGGPSERVLPSHSLNDAHSGGLELPLITSATPQKEYLLNIASKSSMKQETELSRFLVESKSTKLDAAWLEKCKTVFCKTIENKPDATKGNTLQDVLERTVAVKSTISAEAIFTASVSDSESGFKSFKLTTLQELGVKKAIQYGVHLKQLASTSESQENLTKLLRHAGFFLKQQQRQVGSNLRSLNHIYVGFDWFAATIFLMMRGSYDRSWKFLQSFSNLASSAYLWMARMHRSIHLPASLASSSISPILFSSCHCVELLLQVELPLVYHAFRMSGFTAAQICQLWIRQCFWNYLDWSEICHYVTMCMLLGIDYQVYMCVAILRHLQNDILHHQQQQDLVIFLREQPITGFKVGKHLEYMQKLEAKYRKTVLPDMLHLSKP